MPPLKFVIPIVALAMLAGLVARFPASTAIDLAGVPAVDAEAASGTVWNGSLASVEAFGKTFAPIVWELEPASLLSARLRGKLGVRAGGSALSTGFDATRDGRVVVRDGRIDARLEDFPEWSTVGPVSGELTATIDTATLVDGLPVDVSGEAALRNLTYTLGQPFALGDYAMQCRAPVECTISDTAAPFELRAELTVTGDRRFAIDGRIRARPSAPRELVQSLALLGAPDAGGFYPISIAGTLGR